jgi:hypothetical protein
VSTVVIQQTGGTRKSIEAGKAWIEEALRQIAEYHELRCT